MSYEKLGFVSGQTLKAEHLNHMEEGIAKASSGAGLSGAAIIDVFELPTENINNNVIYRLMTGHYIYNQYFHDEFTVHCVETLPEVGLPATNADISEGNIYYCVADGVAYGYVDNMLAMGMGVPAGWYDGDTLITAMGYTYGGVISDINDDPHDDTWRVLVTRKYYMYQDGWCKLPFACEKAPKFDIAWDGDMDGRIALDMSMLGFDQGLYFVKVSDDVFTTDELVGWRYIGQSYDGGIWSSEIYSDVLDTTTYPGAISINDYIVVVYDDAELATALGIPTGIYTNGIYFWLYTEDGYISNLTSPARITKIDSKFIDVDLDIDASSLGLHSVATSGNYNDLYNKPEVYTDVIRYNTNQSLSSTNKTRARNNIDVYSKSEVDTKISNIDVDVDLSKYAKTADVETMISSAIGSAIGGSY